MKPYFASLILGAILLSGIAILVIVAAHQIKGNSEFRTKCEERGGVMVLGEPTPLCLHKNAIIEHRG